MTNSGRMLGCLTGLLAVCVVCNANSADPGPYQGIVDRNVFGLKSPPPPPDPEVNKPPPPNIKLTGITSWKNKKLALMKLTKPGPKPEEQSLILAAGQREGEIEVLEIDEMRGVVKVNDYGTVMSLDFTNNGVKMATAAPVAAPVPGGQPPGMAPQPGTFVPQPGGIPNPVRTLPTGNRPIRTGYPGGSAGMAPASYTPPTSVYSAVPTTPATYPTTYNPGTTVATPGAVNLGGLGAPASTYKPLPNWPPEPTSPEQAAIMEAAYKLRHANDIANGSMPDIPGTNPLLDNGNSQAQTPQPVNHQPMLPIPPGGPRSPFAQ